MKIVLRLGVGGSPKLEELQYRVIASGRLRTIGLEREEPQLHEILRNRTDKKT